MFWGGDDVIARHIPRSDASKLGELCSYSPGDSEGDDVASGTPRGARTGWTQFRYGSSQYLSPYPAP